ncbi:CobW family GTP-binding protein [Janthinobacterium agaricidamnosum]|uniref:CobW/HypB/UreG, nucleotide-binding domain protein n=1 Tax=Janthinobacterium agaricidamnosum NBRC 102515 = DSM 9628 TaxID=1349767 RepID=W0V6J9_9BURK|nr:GTP-binding protein [Janthinobacterium agaricidamnosum]CDG83245.1 cobW/HypB/UreG, nucleotide-binding domain protein [Janthinobacterium agaricidamnosum NBRC 102515 = DSM 9628]
MTDLIPVTIITGFLGSGKTTLLKRILQGKHGYRIAVIENEFAAESIDNDLLIQHDQEQIVEMNNGCICCSVRGDLIRILGELQTKRASGALQFDHLIIETTGMAAPGPVAQTFFAEPSVSEFYLLDAILTVVDARHAQEQLNAHPEAQEQVGFADRILLSKTDLVGKAELAALRSRLVGINCRANIQKVSFGNVPLKDILNIRGFNLNAIVELEPDFLSDHAHRHGDGVQSFVYHNPRPMDLMKIEDFLDAVVQVFGTQMMRYKGILNIAGTPCRAVFQGVHQLMGSELGALWGEQEYRESKMVFIGKNLPQDMLVRGLDKCVFVETMAADVAEVSHVA